LPSGAADASEDSGWTHTYAERFHEALNNDLNTAQALASVLEMVAEGYRRRDYCVWNTLKRFDLVLGLRLEESLGQAREAHFPADIEQLRDEREQARKARDFTRADELRLELERRGYQIRDSKTGPVLMLKRPTP
jgi:cysteinyl-tRNA synthetase